MMGGHDSLTRTAHAVARAVAAQHSIPFAGNFRGTSRGSLCVDGIVYSG